VHKTQLLGKHWKAKSLYQSRNTTGTNVTTVAADVHALFCIQVGPSGATAEPGETLSWGSLTFSRGFSGEKFFECFFQKWCILVYFIFLSDGGPPNVAGPVAVYPLPHPLDGPALT